jgi:hypothetical protein
VWVFNGENAIPSAVFSSRELAEEWIGKNRLTGMLTRYPIDESLYGWAIRNGYFKPKREDQTTPDFIGRFTCASTDHYHYENGLPCGTF